MLFPVRCFTCGAPLAHLWPEYKRRVEAGEDPEKVLDDLGVKRYCCRRMLLTSITYVEEVAKYYTLKAKRLRAVGGGTL
jgi:DNA-directed RNA polymerase subunit N